MIRNSRLQLKVRKGIKMAKKAKSKKKKSTAIIKSKASLAKPQKTELPIKIEKAIKKDIKSIGNKLRQRPELGDILFEGLNRRINSGRVDVREIRETFTWLFGEREGRLLFSLLDTSPDDVEIFLKENNATDETIRWFCKCIISFGIAIGHLKALEERPEDWDNFEVKRFREKVNGPMYTRIEVTRIDKVKQIVESNQKSIVSLLVRLLDKSTNGGKDVAEFPEEELKRFESILTSIKKNMKEKS